MAGYSPSVRLFEAAACGATIVSDNWPGLDSFFEPGREILLPTERGRNRSLSSRTGRVQLRSIGLAAQERVLASHTSQQRAKEFEREVENAQRNERVSLVNSEAGR